MTKPLADHGIATAVVPLPSCGEAGETLGDLYDDVDACRQAITEAHEPVVLCGQSHGEVIITEAGVDDRVTQLLHVTSVMPTLGSPRPIGRFRTRLPEAGSIRLRIERDATGASWVETSWIPL